jgi:hypothetical protein
VLGRCLISGFKGQEGPVSSFPPGILPCKPSPPLRSPLPAANLPPPRGIFLPGTSHPTQPPESPMDPSTKASARAQGQLRCPGGGTGRRARLRILWGNSRAGSIPVPGTIFSLALTPPSPAGQHHQVHSSRGIRALRVRLNFLGSRRRLASSALMVRM